MQRKVVHKKSIVSRRCLEAFLFISLSTGCGGPKAAMTAKKDVSAGEADGAGAPALVALGDNCKPTSVATTIAGFDARIALVASNASEQTHSVGYVGEVANLRLSFSEAILHAPQNGTYSVQVVLRDLKACEEARVNGSTAVCQLNFGRAQAIESFDIKQKISFIVSNTIGEYIKSGTLGTGQNGILSDVVNGDGLIGFLGRTGLLQGLGGGAMGGLGGLIGASDKGNQALAAARAQANVPKGGCSSEAQNSAASAAQNPSSATPSSVPGAQ